MVNKEKQLSDNLNQNSSNNHSLLNRQASLIVRGEEGVGGSGVGDEGQSSSSITSTSPSSASISGSSTKSNSPTDKKIFEPDTTANNTFLNKNVPPTVSHTQSSTSTLHYQPVLQNNYSVSVLQRQQQHINFNQFRMNHNQQLNSSQRPTHPQIMNSYQNNKIGYNNNNSFNSQANNLQHHTSMHNIYYHNAHPHQSHQQQQHGNFNFTNYTNPNNYLNNQPQTSQSQHIYQRQISLPGNIHSYQKLVNQSQHQFNNNNNHHQMDVLSASNGTPSTFKSQNQKISNNQNWTIPRLNYQQHYNYSFDNTDPTIPQQKQQSISPLPLQSPKITELEKIDETQQLFILTPSTVMSTVEKDDITKKDDISSPSEKCISPIVTLTLADLIKTPNTLNSKQEYLRSFVSAVDQLYPNTKWPLHTTWTFWHIKNDPNQSWEDNIKEIVEISYVEDFWSVIAHLYTNASKMVSHGCDIAFFKKGIRPMWEESKSGGSWLHTIHQTQKKLPEIYDVWLETLVTLIGDQFCGVQFLPPGITHTTEHEHICDFISGMYASPRAKQHKIGLWTQNYKDEKTTRLIGKIWKNVLKINENATITFEAHETKYDKNASFKIVYKE